MHAKVKIIITMQVCIIIHHRLFFVQKFVKLYITNNQKLFITF